MNKQLIYQYINKIKKEDIINFSLNQKINLTEQELNTIYSYIKNDYLRFFNNPKEIFIEIKPKLKTTTYNKILELYNKYKFFINK